MDYIIHTRFRGKALCGEVNIPACSPAEEENGLISVDGMPICYANSHIAHQHFSRNDDGKGLLRGKYTQAIQKKLAKVDPLRQTRWNQIWADPFCRKYKRTEHADHWLWNDDFFQADIESLEHIAGIIGVRKGDIQCT